MGVTTPIEIQRLLQYNQEVLMTVDAALALCLPLNELLIEANPETPPNSSSLVDEVQRQSQDFQHELSAVVKAVDKIRTEADKDLIMKQKTISDVLKEIQICSQKINSLEAEISKSSSRVQSLRADVNEFTQNLLQKKASLAQRQAERAQLQADHDAYAQWGTSPWWYLAGLLPGLAINAIFGELVQNLDKLITAANQEVSHATEQLSQAQVRLSSAITKMNTVEARLQEDRTRLDKDLNPKLSSQRRTLITQEKAFKAILDIERHVLDLNNSKIQLSSDIRRTVDAGSDFIGTAQLVLLTSLSKQDRFKAALTRLAKTVKMANESLLPIQTVSKAINLEIGTWTGQAKL